MAALPSKWSIRALTPADDEFVPALHLAVTGTYSHGGRDAPEVRSLLASESPDGLRLRPVVAAFRDGALCNAVVGVESPGAANLLLLPFHLDHPRDHDGRLMALRHARELAHEYGVLLSQVIGPQCTSNWDVVLVESGFTRLTELIYMTRMNGGMVGDVQLERGRELNWVTYSSESELLFCEALGFSYEDSMDCPELSKVRTVRQSLDGHRAVGMFDPEKWFVLTEGERSLGVLLLSKVRGEAVMEFVYMGVSQLARGRGVGDLLMQHAVRLAACEATSLILAVDARNEPARGLYTRWGFAEIARRAAWVASACSNRR